MSPAELTGFHSCKRVTGIYVLVANGPCPTVSHVDNHSIGTTQQDFCLAVEVPVVSHGVNLCAVQTDHVWSAVDPPQALAVQFVGFDNGIIGVRRTIKISRVRIVNALEDNLQLAVAIKVGYTGVVRRIIIGNIFLGVYT